MVETNKSEFNKKISKIINECNDLKVKEKLQLIYDRLNSNNSLEQTGLIQRFKNMLYRLNPQHRKNAEMERLNTAIKELEVVVSEHILSDKIFQHKVLKDYPSEFANTINSFCDLSFGVEFNEHDKSLKRYDIELTDNIKREAYTQILSEMQQTYINGDISLDDLIKETEKKYNQKIDAILNKARKTDISPYYGNKEFMNYRISYIIECINRMLVHPKFEGREDIANDLQHLQEMYNQYKESHIDSDSIEAQKSNYRQLEDLYKQALAIEERLSKDVEQVWKERMSEKNGAQGQMAYLAHVITAGEFDPKEMHKVCATYITEKTLTLPYGDYGYIYPIDMENILQMSCTDAASWKIDKRDFIEKGLCTSWQFAEPIDENGNRMFFEYPPHISKLLLPDDVERRTIENTIKLNGEMLNYDKFMPYNEIMITNKNKQMMPIAVFVKSYGNEQDSPKVQKARALSEKLGIELKIIDVCQLRENLGLPKHTQGESDKLPKGR